MYLSKIEESTTKVIQVHDVVKVVGHAVLPAPHNVED